MDPMKTFFCNDCESLEYRKYLLEIRDDTTRPTSISELRTASENGCSLCTLLLDAVVTASENFDDLNVDDNFTVETLEVDWPVLKNGHRKAIWASVQLPAPEDYLYDDIFDVFITDVLPVDRAHFPFADPLSALRTYPILPKDPACADNIAQAITWIEECTRNHPSCPKARQVCLPKRVLELSETTVTLRDNKEGRANGKYACLSHSWGQKGPSMKLTRLSQTYMGRGFAVDELPRTFQDVVRVCLNLQIHYLWIDALCILQDDPTDWEEAAATMASIYENAYITIAALCSRNSDDGLRPFHDTHFKAKKLRKHNAYIRRRSYEDSHMVQNHLSNEIQWPWMTRAWTYQERLLSPRKLYFAGYQLVWDCREGRQTQDLHTMPETIWFGSAGVPMLKGFDDCSHSPDVTWRLIVDSYATMDLTFETDRLPAIAAIAERMKQIRPQDEYIGGLWRNSFLSDMSWQSEQDGRPILCENRTPSWTWVSAGSISYHSKSPRLVPNVEIIDLNYTCVGPVHLGQIKDATLTLRGPMFDIDAGIMNLSSIGMYKMMSTIMLTDCFPAPPTYDYITMRILPDKSDYTPRGKMLVAMVLYDREEWPRERGGELVYGILFSKVAQDNYIRVGSFHLYALVGDAEKARQDIVSKSIRNLPVRQITVV